MDPRTDYGESWVSSHDGASAGLPSSRQAWAVTMLRRAILSGDIRPGEILRPNELSEAWSLSPTPVREAIQRLSVEGLVEQQSNRAARAASASLAEAKEIFDLRMVLEPMATRSSVIAAAALPEPDGWRKTITGSFDRFADAMSRPDVAPLDEEVAHRAFHLALVEYSESKWLKRFVELLLDHSARYRVLAWKPADDEARRSMFEGHRPLYDAFMAGDVEEVTKQTSTHIRCVRDLQSAELAKFGLE